jgi:putative oxidoreductase
MSHTLSAAATTTPSRSAARRGKTAAVWAVQVLLAVQFAAGGLLKATGEESMVAMFTEIGAGQWLRYLVAACELAGALGLLVPRLAGPAALGIVGLMAGATVTNVVILGTSPAVPLAFLLLSAVVAGSRRAQTRDLLRRAV